ncbi:MAG: xanthine dehydrogenase family protein subunit M [Chloroflexota bacterium]
MIPAAFDYVRPADLDEVLGILRDRQGEAKLLSGGYSLLPLLKLRLAQPELLVDLRDVGGLDGIVHTDDDIRIGGRVTHKRIQEDEGLARSLPIMREAAVGIGDPQVRNWGTIGGSVAHADPSSDWPAVLLALGASVVLRSAGGERVMPVRGFFLDTFVTQIEPTEVLTEVRIPHPARNGGGAYKKLERRAGDFSTVGVAVQLALSDDGRIASIGIGLTAVADAPFAATEAEKVLTDARPGNEVIQEAAAMASKQSKPVTDSHGPADYKRAMVAEMTTRAIRAALQRAGA